MDGAALQLISRLFMITAVNVIGLFIITVCSLCALPSEMMQWTEINYSHRVWHLSVSVGWLGHDWWSKHLTTSTPIPQSTALGKESIHLTLQYLPRSQSESHCFTIPNLKSRHPLDCAAYFIFVVHTFNILFCGTLNTLFWVFGILFWGIFNISFLGDIQHSLFGTFNIPFLRDIQHSLFRGHSTLPCGGTFLTYPFWGTFNTPFWGDI